MEPGQAPSATAARALLPQRASLEPLPAAPGPARPSQATPPRGDGGRTAHPPRRRGEVSISGSTGRIGASSLPRPPSATQRAHKKSVWQGAGWVGRAGWAGDESGWLWACGRGGSRAGWWGLGRGGRGLVGGGGSPAADHVDDDAQGVGPLPGEAPVVGRHPPVRRACPPNRPRTRRPPPPTNTCPAPPPPQARRGRSQADAQGIGQTDTPDRRGDRQGAARAAGVGDGITGGLARVGLPEPGCRADGRRGWGPQAAPIGSATPSDEESGEDARDEGEGRGGVEGGRDRRDQGAGAGRGSSRL
jgi:hypothetical protein